MSEYRSIESVRATNPVELYKNTNYSNGFLLKLQSSICKALNLPSDTDPKKVAELFDNIIGRANETKLTELKLKLTLDKLAELTVDKMVREKVIKPERRNHYYKMACIDLETAKQLALTENEKNILLPPLLKLSGRELYMQGKFEALKKIDINVHNEKYLEYFGKPYTGK